jgi:phosphomevalonate kinase
MAILSEVHRDLRRLARDVGVTYKPSGAGGGDIGLLLTDDPARATAAMEAVRRAGFAMVDVPLAPVGLS